MKKYESYNDSRIEWIGEIPSHWEVKKLKYVSSINDDTLSDTTEDEFEIEYADISSIESGVGITKTDHFTFKEAPSRARRLVKDGDVIVSTVRTYLKAIAKVKNPKPNLVVSTGFAVVRPKDIVSEYAGHLFFHENLLGEIVSRSVGVSYPAINSSEIGSIKIPLPKSKEQTAIAHYLDRKTAEVDGLIADKKRLLKLYEEEKSATINQAVTKGVNPDIPMKDSGIEWLGEIPEHCDTASFNHYVFLRHGYQFRNYDFTSTGLKVIKITQLKATGELEVNDVSFIDESRLNEFKDILIEEGDILMALTGGTIGKIIRAPKINEPLLQNYRVGNFFSKNDSITKDFLFWVLSSDLILKQIFFDQRETGQPNIGKEDFGRMFLILPNKIEEQDEIVSFIKNEVERINAKKAKTEKLIDLLTEYRTALISEVVTGKVKVI